MEGKTNINTCGVSELNKLDIKSIQNYAIIKMQKVPMMLSTDSLNIKDVNPPLLTICPLKQYNVSKMSRFGYDHEYFLLLGGDAFDEERNSSSWGAHVNMTFHDMVDISTDHHDHYKIIEYNEDLELNPILNPKFGYCLESKNYSLDVISINLFEKLDNDMVIFLTDNSMRSNYGIYYPSQDGVMKIETQKSLVYTHRAEITIYDKKLSADEDGCINDKNYKLSQCIEEETYKDLNTKYGCVPAWLSSKNPCGVVISKPFIEYFSLNYVEQYFYLLDTTAQKKCKLPCVEQKIKIQVLGAHPNSAPGSFIKIELNQRVTRFVKLPNYNILNFLVDVGSSMGLWLGLSALSLYDNGVGTINYFKSIARKFY